MTTRRKNSEGLARLNILSSTFSIQKPPPKWQDHQLLFKPKARQMNPSSPYDLLYEAAEGQVLWGAEPGRLVKRIQEFCSAGIVVDAGCGDGKNALYLEKLGFTVIGYDSSRLALKGLENRFRRVCWKKKGRYELRDITQHPIEKNIDALVSYGLFHCLPPLERLKIHSNLHASVKPCGITLFTCLTDRLPLPRGHQTKGIELPDISEVLKLFTGWKLLHKEEGEIEEKHSLLVGLHKHSAIWIVAKKQYT